MKKAAVEQLISHLLTERELPVPLPSEADWQKLKNKFSSEFEESFIAFVELVAHYHVPLQVFVANDLQEQPADWNETYNVGTIAQIYDMERQLQSGDAPWQQSLIPFASLGNGDTYCIMTSSTLENPVYFVRHEDGKAEKVSETFEEWLISFVAQYEEVHHSPAKNA